MDSEPATIAVNFWWERPASAGPLPKAYVLRHTLQVCLQPCTPQGKPTEGVNSLAAKQRACSLASEQCASEWAPTQDLVEERMTAELAGLEPEAASEVSKTVSLCCCTSIATPAAQL